MKPKIVFFGSGPVAAKSLELLLEDFEIEAIITKPSTVKEMSEITHSAPVHAVGTKSELDQLISSKNFESQLGILIDFGIIVSQAVIDYFPQGIVNSHFSLLPEWRGADPITFSILSGQKTTGVSLMLLVEAMDEGPLLAQAPYDIPEGTATPELTATLIELSAWSLREIIPLYLQNKTTPAPQESVSSTEVSYSRKLTKEDGVLDWNKPAELLEREVRAFIEWPKSRTTIAGLDVVILSTKVVNKQIEPCGKFWVENKQLFVSCGKDSLEILTLKPAGKKEMPAEAFLAGYGDRLK
jgi:methionyl-tRNA formyltransferase